MGLVSAIRSFWKFVIPPRRSGKKNDGLFGHSFIFPINLKP